MFYLGGDGGESDFWFRNIAGIVPKLILGSNPARPFAGEDMLFDVVADPSEGTNLAPLRPALVREMKEEARKVYARQLRDGLCEGGAGCEAGTSDGSSGGSGSSEARMLAGMAPEVQRSFARRSDIHAHCGTARRRMEGWPGRWGLGGALSWLNLAWQPLGGVRLSDATNYPHPGSHAQRSAAAKAKRCLGAGMCHAGGANKWGMGEGVHPQLGVEKARRTFVALKDDRFDPREAEASERKRAGVSDARGPGRRETRLPAAPEDGGYRILAVSGPWLTEEEAAAVPDADLCVPILEAVTSALLPLLLVSLVALLALVAGTIYYARHTVVYVIKQAPRALRWLGSVLEDIGYGFDNYWAGTIPARFSPSNLTKFSFGLATVKIASHAGKLAPRLKAISKESVEITFRYLFDGSKILDGSALGERFKARLSKEIASALGISEGRLVVGFVIPDDVDWRGRLQAFYAKHNPSKLASVDSTLAKYKGREGQLFLQLQKKYNTSVSALGTGLGALITITILPLADEMPSSEAVSLERSGNKPQ